MIATFITLLMRSSPSGAPIRLRCIASAFLCCSLFCRSCLFGDALGGFVGLVVIVCYDVCGMVFLLYIVDCSRRLDLSAYLLAGAYLGGSALSLLAGLGIGSVLRALSVDYGLSLLTLLAFAAIYPLAGVFMFGLRKIQRRSTTDADESARSGSMFERTLRNARASTKRTPLPRVPLKKSRAN